MKNKICPRCKKNKCEKYPAGYSRKFSVYCKECNKLNLKKYNQKEDVKKKKREYQKEYSKKQNPNKKERIRSSLPKGYSIRDWKKKNIDKVKLQRKRHWIKSKDNPNEKIKAKSRRTANYKIKIKKCEICGEKAIERHHPDYRFPLWVIPVCGDCHRKLHLIDYKGGNKMENQNLDDIGPIQSATVDLAKYDKQTTTIEKAEVTQLPSQFTPLIPGTQQHYMQWVLKVSSVVLESIREGEDKIEFRATEVFNLVQDEKGNLKGFPTGEGAKLMKFLKDLKVPSPDHLKSLKEVIEAVKGKQCVIKTEAKEKDGRTNTYLRFRY